MATQAASKPPRETPSTPTKARSAASSVKGSSVKDSPKSTASKAQKQVGKDNKTPRKLKRKVDDTVTPAAERTASPTSATKDLPSRPATGKKSVPSKRLEQRVPEPEPEEEEQQEEPQEQEEQQQQQDEEEAGIQLRDNDADEVQEQDDQGGEEEGDLPEPSVSAPAEQRGELADNQSQASGSATGGFFGRTGSGLNSFARGLRGVAGSLSQGKVKGAAGGATETAQGTVGDIANSLPLDLSALKGLEVGEGGKIFDKSGNALGEVVEGDPEDLVGQTVGDDGEIVDEDGDLIGRVELLDEVQNKVTETLDQVKDKLPSLEDLKGLPVSEGGEIKDEAGNVLGRIVEGDPEDLVGQTINESGEILDEDGDLIGRAEVISPEEALKTIQEKGADLSDVEETAEDAVPDDLQNKVDEVKNNLPQLADLDGLPVSDGGEIKDKAGNVVAKVVEGDPEDLVGQTVNDAGEILDEDGDLIGRVEVLSPDEAAQKVIDTFGNVKDQAAEATEGLVPQIQILQGKKINKKGKILDEEGEVIGQVAEGSEVKDLAGKKPNEKGEVLDKEGNVLGKVEIVPGEAADEALKSLQEEVGEAGEAGEGAAEGAVDKVKDLAALDGLQVNDEGNVVDSDGNVLAKLESGNLDEIAGHTVNEKGLVIDDDGNILGRVSLIGDEAQEAAGEAAEDAQEVAPELPPLSTLEGLKVNKFGKIMNDDGVPVGELTEGDAKKLSKLGVTLDDKGQFWDNHGNVIGKAQTIPVEDHETEGPFAGLEGLIVVKDGWVEDDNGNRVGQLVEGDAQKLVGRAVDEDGDIVDKRGNVVGRAERYEQPEEEEPEPEKPDFSSVAGLKPNKAGNVIGPDGVPIARVVEGNLKEVTGLKIDNEGQIWNDAGKVVGRVELIPEDERETKPEGIFGGLEGLVVNKDGFVEDEEGNIVGKLVEGDAKKLRGRAVDEDGDILDKHGNVKGRAEPYEPPEEEPEEEEDLSSLEGKTVNKMGNVVDEHGTIFGRIAEGDPKKLAGKRVDGKGQIWSDNGKVIGRAELIPGNEQGKPEGAFFGFDDAKVGKDGVVVDASDKIIGRLIEGDAKKLVGRPVDEDGDILDKSGNVIGKAERWEPEEKKRDVNPMSGRKVNKQGEVRDENGDLIGKVTEGNLQNLIGKSIDDNGYIVDNDGNKIGEATLIENIPEPEEPEEEISPEELEKQKQEENDRKLADRMCAIVQDTIGKIQPVCKQITDLIEKADHTPKDELDEEKLVQDVKPLLEEGGRILQECNGAIRALDPDGRIAATAKARAQTHEATPEEYRLADSLKELTETVVKTIDNGRKRIANMPHAKKKLNPLWSLLAEPLFQIIAAVGLLLSGVLGLVSRLLDGLGLGGLVRGLLGGLGVDKLLEGLGLGTITESLGFGKKK